MVAARPINICPVPMERAGIRTWWPADRTLRQKTMDKPVIIDNRAAPADRGGSRAVAKRQQTADTFCVLQYRRHLDRAIDRTRRGLIDFRAGPSRPSAPSAHRPSWSSSRRTCTAKDAGRSSMCPMPKANPGEAQKYGLSSGPPAVDHYASSLFQAEPAFKVVNPVSKGEGAHSTAAGGCPVEVDFSFAKMDDGLPAGCKRERCAASP